MRAHNMTTEEWQRYAAWTMDSQLRRLENQNAKWDPPESEDALMAVYKAGQGGYGDE